MDASYHHSRPRVPPCNIKYRKPDFNGLNEWSLFSSHNEKSRGKQLPTTQHLLCFHTLSFLGQLSQCSQFMVTRWLLQSQTSHLPSR